MASIIVKDIRPYGSDIIGDVEVSVDLSQIAHDIGWRALRNKSGKSKYLKGAVVIRAINKRKLPKPGHGFTVGPNGPEALED